MSASIRRAQARAREQQAWRLRLDGLTEQEIADKLGIAQSSVHNILRRVEQATLAEARQFVLRYKARQLGRLEAIHAEAVAGFRRSQIKSVTRASEATPNEGPPTYGPDGRPQPAAATIKKLRVREEERDGDPAWLNLALSTHDRIAALLGLNAPAKMAVAREETPEEQMTDAELRAALRAELDADERALGVRTIDVEPQA